MIEVEVKVHLNDPKYVERRIISLGAVPTAIENQADTYYNMPWRDFSETDEALRIRVQDGEAFLTYKGPKMDLISKTRKEIQVKILDENDMGEILTSLGFFPVATVTKKRKNYRLGEIVIALDEVRELGNFMEMEISVKKSMNYEEKVERLFKFIEKLGIERGSTIRKSYLEMILEKNNTLNCSPMTE